jgi:hypothetical protein
MRTLVMTLAVVGLGATGALGQGSQCTYRNQFFSSGAVSCQDGAQYRCVAGAWQANGLQCADSNADGDQGALQVDPSRGAPKVHDPAVRQPSPPVVPQD